MAEWSFFMSINIITISREYGSGGRLIGKTVAEKLGWKFLDREIIEAAARESGLSEKFIEQSGEYASATTSLLFNLSVGNNPDGGMMSLYNEVFNVQREIICKAADEGRCVIVGRCADYILRERDNCMNVFIHASTEKRANRIVAIYGDDAKSPEKRLKEMDKKRRVYCRNFTGQEWGEVHNYQLCIDSGFYGIEKSADIIAETVK